MIREVSATPGFAKLLKRLPATVRQLVREKLNLYVQDPSHPSLRVKRLKGTRDVWEMSITMNYRLTFEIQGERMILRRIGTHDVLRSP